MSNDAEVKVRRGDVLRDDAGRRIGWVDAVFVDYALVRTAGLLPIDLYVPIAEMAKDDGSWRVTTSRRGARERWHRPLKRAPHADQ